MRFVLALLAAVLVPGLAAAAGKIALVIGNDAYQQVTPLERAAADARAYRDMLSGDRGFDVIYAENADRNEMISKVGEFLGRIRPDDVAMVVYSGHGVQLDPNRGDTLYLLPTDIPSVDPGSGGASFFMDARAINFARLSTEVEARGAALRIFVLDACRNNPFPPAPGGRSIGLTRGLGSFNSSRGEFVFFAAAPGEVALDFLPDDEGSANSVFTRVFLKHFRQGEYLEDVANDVQAEVLELSRRAAISQEPYYTDGVAGKTCIDTECGVVPAPAAPAAASPADDLEATFWRLCETRDTVSYCKAYLDPYPEGPHALLAKLRVDELTATAASGQETGKPRLVTVGPASVTGQAPAPEPVPAAAAAAGAEPELKSNPPVPLPLTTAPEPAAAPTAEPAAQPAPPPEPDTKLAAVEPAQQAPSVADQQKAEEERQARRAAAAQEWGRLAGSWDIRAVRDFRNNYSGTSQAAEADQRIAFLTQRHREAQSELNRLGYDAGPVDGAAGVRDRQRAAAQRHGHRAVARPA